jgi:hypothetical protein
VQRAAAACSCTKRLEKKAVKAAYEEERVLDLSEQFDYA